MDAERSRRIEESKDETSDVNTQRRETYNRLVMVQEDLLKTIQRMKVGGRERWREGEVEGGRKGGVEGGRKEGVEGGRGGGREGWRERGVEGERKGGRELSLVKNYGNLRTFKDYETSS